MPPLLVEVPDPSVGRLDTKVNKGCTVTAQSQHRMEASCQLPARVQSWLMASEKALRKRGNFRNSKSTNALSHMDGFLVLGKTALDSMQMASQGGLSALGHWGLTRGDEGYGLTSGDGEPEYFTHPSLEWPKRVSVSQMQLLRVPELSLQESVVGTALFKMDNLH